MKNTCAFNLTEKVFIDGCKSIPCVVTAILFRVDGCKCEVSYWSEARLVETWVDEWRLSKWEE